MLKLCICTSAGGAFGACYFEIVDAKVNHKVSYGLPLMWVSVEAMCIHYNARGFVFRFRFSAFREIVNWKQIWCLKLPKWIRRWFVVTANDFHFIEICGFRSAQSTRWIIIIYLFSALRRSNYRFGGESIMKSSFQISGRLCKRMPNAIDAKIRSSHNNSAM